MPIVRLADRGLRTYSMPMNYFNYLFFLVVYGAVFSPGSSWTRRWKNTGLTGRG